MKCIKVLNGISQELKNIAPNTILKVDDKAAKRFVDSNEAEYVPRHEWKEQEAKLNQ
jgi:hypothetical protein|tara:strand:+ start:397 stop:567 length:171 start_codon:yes stop_codon:yes gene_type:complete